LARCAPIHARGRNSSPWQGAHHDHSRNHRHRQSRSRRNQRRESPTEQRFTGRVVLVGDESERPNDRPPLSNTYLAGTASREDIHLHPQSSYDQNAFELGLGQTAVARHREKCDVELCDGTLPQEDKLLVATGPSPRRLDIAGADGGGVRYLRRVANAGALRNPRIEETTGGR
jgi:NADPH-dependent 2,4-dienoyl-CoA reductase/sulfur reductase-like enzyme